MTACLCRSACIGDGPVRWHEDSDTARPGVDLEAPLRGRALAHAAAGSREAKWGMAIGRRTIRTVRSRLATQCRRSRVGHGTHLFPLTLLEAQEGACGACGEVIAVERPGGRSLCL